MRNFIKITNGASKTVAAGGIPASAAKKRLPEILFVTSYPPRECGIATYSQDLIKALNNKFGGSFLIRVCPLESENEIHTYPRDIQYVLNTDEPASFARIAGIINQDDNIKVVMIQHEFGFFQKKEEEFRSFLVSLCKPIVLVFHTVLPRPDDTLKANVRHMSAVAESIIVMTNTSRGVLAHDYSIAEEKISVIAHGTHLVRHSDKKLLKEKYALTGKHVLSTFGLLSSGKSIETTLDALPAIIRDHPDVLFLIIGKTHPSVVKQEGEKYRAMLEAKVIELQLGQYVRFIDRFVPLPELLEYLQLTDIYLFTSNDPNQAVSGTFSYAISCGCPIISTPIPHAREVLKNDAGITIDFQNSGQLAQAAINLLNDEELRKNIGSNALHRMSSTAWENAAISHAMLVEKITPSEISLSYAMPGINLDHIKKMTTEFGMIQFSKINQPDIGSGYTLDDNARALIAMCKHFELTMDGADVKYIRIFFDFLKHCLQPDGRFLNYVNEERAFTEQNDETNLEDANGRAIWALGYMTSTGALLPRALSEEAESVMEIALSNVHDMHSTRAMAFVIKGLYFYNMDHPSVRNTVLIKEFANRLVEMYRSERDGDWHWFESYLTYANSIIPEAMLCAWSVTGDPVYHEIARSSFAFLLSKTFYENRITVISNKSWLHKGNETLPTTTWGEQPIDVAYTILALKKFYDVFKERDYLEKMRASFDWFLGSNHLHQIIYNPCTGGCYDGLEENYVNLNQGAESTVSYLMARLALEKYLAGNKDDKRGRDRYLEFSLQTSLK